jgi:23S rRNA (cytidine1920-2'-O)/16S rRNA (cytidine1409-2'-O)-methyltransferase
VDVGTSQLADSLRQHPQVVFYENQDVRQLTLSQLDSEPVDAIVADLSFISLTLVLPAFPPLFKPDGFLVLLIKPQFEPEQRTALKGGIVKDPKLREAAVQRVLACAESLSFQLKGLTETEVEVEGKRNVEYLCWLAR